MLDSPTWDGTLTSSLQIPGETGSIQGRYRVDTGFILEEADGNVKPTQADGTGVRSMD